MSDEYFMKLAFQQAEIAFEKDEVPVGAIVVIENKIIAKAHNLTETLTDVTAHAEMQAITSAASYLNSKYLDECRMYVTLEPCLMCAGALFWAKLGHLIYGASDEKKGFYSQKNAILHPKTKITKGILEVDCSKLLLDFFNMKR